MKHSLRTAAKATGKSPAAIQRAIKIGRLSAPKNDKGYYEIDPAELHRVYPPVNDTRQPERTEGRGTTPNNNSGLQVELEILKQERVREREQFQTHLEDLKKQRDKAMELAEKAQETVLRLTHQQEQQQKTAPKPEPKQMSFFGFEIRRKA